MRSQLSHPQESARPASLAYPWIPATPAVEVPPLLEAEVHLWVASLDAPFWSASRLYPLLSPDEQRRADSFHFKLHRRRFTVGRAGLRALLQGYLGMPAAHIVFTYNAYGKPAVAPELNPRQVVFNLSHSHSQVVYAFTRSSEIGVDVECIRCDFPFEEVAATVFTPLENRFIRQAHPDERCRRFFGCWTHKEAYIKGRGKGLSIPLNEFDVILPSGCYSLHPPWSFVPVPQLSGYEIALAIKRACATVKCFEMQAGVL